MGQLKLPHPPKQGHSSLKSKTSRTNADSVPQSTSNFDLRTAFKPQARHGDCRPTQGGKEERPPSKDTKNHLARKQAGPEQVTRRRRTVSRASTGLARALRQAHPGQTQPREGRSSWQARSQRLGRRKLAPISSDATRRALKDLPLAFPCGWLKTESLRLGPNSRISTKLGVSSGLGTQAGRHVHASCSMEAWPETTTRPPKQEPTNQVGRTTRKATK